MYIYIYFLKSSIFIKLFFNLNLFILIGGELLYTIVLVLPYINMYPPQVSKYKQQKEYCKKFNKGFKNGPYQRKLKKKFLSSILLKIFLKISLIWTIFKAFIEFFTILLLLFIFWSVWQWGMWDLSSPTKDWTHTPYTGRQSLNHQTTRKVPVLYLVKLNLLHRCSVLSFRGC